MDGTVADGGSGRCLPGAGRPDRAVLRPPERVDPDAFRAAVLALTRQIPAARVLTYGDVAELLERGGPRQVGRVLSRSTGGLPWWRVLRSGGHPPQGLAGRARPHYEEEGTPLSVRDGATDPAAYRVDLLRARWAPTGTELDMIAGLARTPLMPPEQLTRGSAPGPSNVRGV